jgi:UDP-N-acetylmuramyl pentapeptide phosphotransferase/UDP-N-acetylglucosamine-1-phosphate transferase
MSMPFAAWVGWCVAGFLIAFATTGLLRRYALSRRLLDQPDERRNHVVPTPRGGGLSIALVVLLSYCVLVWMEPSTALRWGGFASGLGMVAGIGWLDDHRPLSVRLRLFVHVLAAGLMSATAWSIGGGLPEMVLAFGAAIILINVWNFMDGIDGLATTQGMIVSACGLWLAGGAGIVSLLSLLVLAGCAGFLPWNFPKARIFLGDAGSGALGYSIAGILMASMVQGRDSAMLLLLPMAAFLVDAGCTLLLRMLKHEKWWMAHSQHSYQVLARRCGSHVRVTMVYAFFSISCMAFTWFLSFSGSESMVLGVMAVYAFAAILWWRIRGGGLRSSGKAGCNGTNP